jgi:hypothetical protein
MTCGAMGWKYLQVITWPTDLYILGQLRDPRPVDVGVVGSSRSHYALSPSAIDQCLGRTLGRPTRTVAANRLAASAYQVGLTARDVFAGRRAPRVLVLEVAPDALARDHFELNYNVSSSADVRDVPECLVAAVRGRPRAAACLRPLVRGVENLAFLLVRSVQPTNEHVRWMAVHEDGGNYCFGDAACEQRNITFDRDYASRWEARERRVLPKIRSERFKDYQIEGGLPARHIVAAMNRGREDGAAVFVVNLPVAEAYAREIPPEHDAAFRAWIARAAATAGARLLDLDTPDRRARPLFIDPDHVNAIGAKRLSEALCAEVAGALH